MPVCKDTKFDTPRAKATTSRGVIYLLPVELFPAVCELVSVVIIKVTYSIPKIYSLYYVIQQCIVKKTGDCA